MITSILTACDRTEPDNSDEPSSTVSKKDDPSDKTTDKDDDGYKTLAEETGYGYLATYSSIEAEFKWAYNPVLLADGRLKLEGTTYSEEEGYQSRYATMNLDGTDVQYLSMHEFGENEYIQTYASLEDGGMWAMTYEWVSSGTVVSGGDLSVYENLAIAAGETAAVAVTSETSDESVEEGTDSASDDWMNSTADGDWSTDDSDADDVTDGAVDDDIWIDVDDGTTESPEIYESYEVYRLYRLDAEGNIIAQPDISEIVDGVDYFYANFMLVGQDGNLYLGGEQKVYKLSADGTLIGSLEVENWINSGFMMKDGSILINYYSDTGMQLCPIQTETMELGEPITLDDDSWYDYKVGGGSYDMYLDDDDTLYGYNMATGEKTALLNWMDSDVDRYSMNGYVVVDETKIIFLYQDDNGNLELGTLNRVPYSEIPVREIITLGGNYLNYDIRRLVSKFNRTNQEYRITFVDYSKYNTEEAENGGLNRLNMELAAGKGPDILLESLLDDLSLYVSKGFLVDLYTLMEDSPYQKEDLVPGYCAATEIDGGLYVLNSSFQITGLWTNAEYLGDDGVLSLDELLAACKALPEDGVIAPYTTRDEMLSSLLMTSYDDLIDMETGECYFDTPEFAKLLEFCSLFPEKIDWETYSYNYSNTYRRIRNKEQIFDSMSIYSLSDLKWQLSSMKGMDGLACVGVPGIQGANFIVYSYNGMAINANGSHKDTCWEFLSQLLSDEYQNDYVSYELSVRQDLLEKQAQEATQKPYYYDEDGNKVEYEQTTWDSETDEEIPVNPLTQEEVDYFLEIINSANRAMRTDEELVTIVTEEAGAYFAGQKPADEVARLIQNRVWTYVNENR